MKRIFWIKDRDDKIIAITSTYRGEFIARGDGYHRVKRSDMTEDQRVCLRNFDKSRPTKFPAKHII